MPHDLGHDITELGCVFLFCLIYCLVFCERKKWFLCSCPTPQIEIVTFIPNCKSTFMQPCYCKFCPMFDLLFHIDGGKQSDTLYLRVFLFFFYITKNLTLRWACRLFIYIVYEELFTLHFWMVLYFTIVGWIVHTVSVFLSLVVKALLDLILL